MCRSHANAKCKQVSRLESCAHPFWPVVESSKEQTHEARWNVIEAEIKRLSCIIKPLKVNIQKQHYVSRYFLSLLSSLPRCSGLFKTTQGNLVTEGVTVAYMLQLSCCPAFLYVVLSLMTCLQKPFFSAASLLPTVKYKTQLLLGSGLYKKDVCWRVTAHCQELH